MQALHATLNNVVLCFGLVKIWILRQTCANVCFFTVLFEEHYAFDYRLENNPYLIKAIINRCHIGLQYDIYGYLEG